MTIYSNDQIAQQLTNAFWEYNGSARRFFNVDIGGQISVNIAGLTSAGKILAQEALELWSGATGLNFIFATGIAQINFDDSDSGAYSWSSISGSNIDYSYVNISTDWISYYGTGLNTYSLQTYVHEIGHALGLGHAGNYNGSATYGVDNQYDNDSWQASVMSYFAQWENTSITASGAYAIAPQVADIIAIRDLYGTTSTTRTGDTVYGDNANSGDLMAQISSFDTYITYTIIDDGGSDTLDFSNSSYNQVINLQEESISSVRGYTGNLMISRGTIIENAIGGSGNDTFFLNSAENMISGGMGSDTAIVDSAFDDVFIFKTSENEAYIAQQSALDHLFDIENYVFEASNTSLQISDIDYFSSLEYIASYQDLSEGFGANKNDGVTHFLNYGRFEGRSVSFDAMEYIASYTDLINAFGANADYGASHFINYGRNEGRSTSFNGLEYIASYSDLMAAFGASADLGASHFISYGVNEGRNTSFNGLEYIASYSDLIAAFGANADLGASHFISYGVNEGRNTPFNGLEYIASYTDLINAFGANADYGASHFIKYGQDEGRYSTFDIEYYLNNVATSDISQFFSDNYDAATMYYIDLQKGTIPSDLTYYVSYFDDYSFV